MRVEIRLNGETRRVPVGQSLTALVAELGFAREKLAIERNLEIVPASAWQETHIAEGDQIEIIHAVGGG